MVPHASRGRRGFPARRVAWTVLLVVMAVPVLPAAGASVPATHLPVPAFAAPHGAIAPLSAHPATGVNFNRHQAVWYAAHYWNVVTSDGYFWNSSGTYVALPQGTNVVSMTGDDCAHFASSVIGNESHQAGGGLNIPSRVPPTYGEPGAGALGDLLINNGWAVTVSNVSQLLPGDLINYEWTSGAGWEHIAVYLGNGTVAAHTNSHYGANWTLGGAVLYRFIHILAASDGQFQLTLGTNPATDPDTGTPFVAHYTISGPSLSGPVSLASNGTAMAGPVSLPLGNYSISASPVAPAWALPDGWSLNAGSAATNGNATNSTVSLTIATAGSGTESLGILTAHYDVTGPSGFASPSWACSNQSLVANQTYRFEGLPVSPSFDRAPQFAWDLNTIAGGATAAPPTASTAVANASYVTGGAARPTFTVTDPTTHENATAGDSCSYSVISVPVVGTLSAVSVTPATLVMHPGQSDDFQAAPTCTGGPCPTGLAFAWQTNNSLGTLNTTSGTSVALAAGAVPGNLSLTVTASWNGTTATAHATVTVVGATAAPVLVSVSLTPGPAITMPAGAAESFSAVARCSPGPCPAGVMLTWDLAGDPGTLNATVGPSVTFAAGAASGTGTLAVLATLGNVTERSTTSITVTGSAASTSPGPVGSGFLGLPGNEGYLLLGTVAGVVLLALIGVAVRRRRRPPT